MQIPSITILIAINSLVAVACGTSAAPGKSNQALGGTSAPTATGGGVSIAGGGSSATGGVAMTSGGVSATSGGVSATSGGVSASSGGAPATTGGASAASGGSSWSTGGTGISLGGSQANTGGEAATSGGNPANTGGSAASTGGAAPTGGAASGTGGSTASSTGGSTASGTGGSAVSGGSSGVVGGASSQGGNGSICSAAGGGTIAAAGACATDGPPIPSCVNGPQVTDQPNLLDDFEDCDSCLRLVASRRGFWFTYDRPGWHVPEFRTDTLRGSRVLHALGHIETTDDHWGLAVWPNATTYCNESPIDLSQYSGISFWAKNVTGAALNVTVRDSATTVNTPTEMETSPNFPITIGSEWGFYKVHWSDLRRSADQSPAIAQSIVIIKWEGAQTQTDYELLLDDVGFFND